MNVILEENKANYISLESLINVDFGKKNMNCHFFFNSTKENCKNDRETDHTSFSQTNELIGYQISEDFCETWPEPSLDVVKQVLGIFIIYNISPMAIFNAICIPYSLLLKP